MEPIWNEMYDAAKAVLRRGKYRSIYSTPGIVPNEYHSFTSLS